MTATLTLGWSSRSFLKSFASKERSRTSLMEVTVAVRSHILQESDLPEIVPGREADRPRAHLNLDIPFHDEEHGLCRITLAYDDRIRRDDLGREET